MPPDGPTRRSPARWVYLTIGAASLALAFAGVFLPVLPTTPLALVAAWAFGRSSPRFEAWLLRHPWFGPPIRRWRAHRVIPMRAKRAAWGAMAIALAATLASGRVPPWALAAQVLLLGYGAWFISRCPSEAPGEREAPAEACEPG
jgi:uncharacterized membrane protein YbaN (DUF454 family)